MATVSTGTSPVQLLQTVGVASILLGVSLFSYSYLTSVRLADPSINADKPSVIVVDNQGERSIAAKAYESNNKTSSSATDSSKPTTNSGQAITARLMEKSQVSPDTVSLRFEFADNAKVVPVGKHIKVFCPNPNPEHGCKWNDEIDPEAGKDIVERKYTPTSSTEKGFVLVVKAYKPNDKFRNGGKVSQYLANLIEGDEINVALPFGIMEYFGSGQFKKSKQLFNATMVGMIAGGSGITPMLRLVESALADSNDPTKFSLIFANRSECDIILREHLDELAARHADRFKVAYTLTRPPLGWKGETGLVTKDMIKAHMPPSSPSTLILCCGPPQMIKTCCKDNLEALGYSPQQTWDF